MKGYNEVIASIFIGGKSSAKSFSKNFLAEFSKKWQQIEFLKESLLENFFKAFLKINLNNKNSNMVIEDYSSILEFVYIFFFNFLKIIKNSCNSFLNDSLNNDKIIKEKSQISILRNATKVMCEYLKEKNNKLEILKKVFSENLKVKIDKINFNFYFIDLVKSKYEFRN